MSECIFCSIVAKELDTEFVFEDERIVAFADRQPVAPIHLLVIPKDHVPSIEEADAALRHALLETATLLGRRHSDEHGYRIAINGGDQIDVPHLHVHVVGGSPRLGHVAVTSDEEVSAT